MVKRKDLIIVKPLEKVAVIYQYVKSQKKHKGKNGDTYTTVYEWWVRIYWAKARQSDGVLTLRLLKSCDGKFDDKWEARARCMSRNLRIVEGKVGMTRVVYTEEQVMLMALAGEIED